MSLTELRAQILAAALPQLAFEGVTDKALARGALASGLPPEAAARAFPGGVAEMIRFWSQTSDKMMLTELERIEPKPQRLSDRIAKAVRLRLEADADHREAVRRTASYLALPWNATLALHCLWATVDTIWYAVGDSATDFSWYTKRATLAAVYGATLLRWLDDESENSEATWAFLERRIGETTELITLRSRLGARFTRPGNWRRARPQH
ncbi:MAG: COQ9 family protein [Defluviicoccus sp.]